MAKASPKTSEVGVAKSRKVLERKCATTATDRALVHLARTRERGRWGDSKRIASGLEPLLQVLFEIVVNHFAWFGASLQIAAIALVISICSPVNAVPPPDIPIHNRADQTSTPPRPPEGDLLGKIQKLWEAIVRNDPNLAAKSFFPREAFLLIKNMANPGRYYDRLRSRFDQDIHDLHRSTANLDDAVFDHFELARRGGFVRVNQEGNRLPYWASRHSSIYYRVGKKLRRIEVRVLITWDDRWYVIHLNEFK